MKICLEDIDSRDHVDPEMRFLARRIYMGWPSFWISEFDLVFGSLATLIHAVVPFPGLPITWSMIDSLPPADNQAMTQSICVHHLLPAE